MVVMASSWSTVVLVGVRTIVAVAAPGPRRWIRRVRPGFVAGSTPAGPGTRVGGSLASAASLGAGGDPEFGVDVAEVEVDGARADEQARGDVLLRAPAGRGRRPGTPGSQLGGDEVGPAARRSRRRPAVPAGRARPRRRRRGTRRSRGPPAAGPATVGMAGGAAGARPGPAGCAPGRAPGGDRACHSRASRSSASTSAPPPSTRGGGGRPPGAQATPVPSANSDSSSSHSSGQVAAARECRALDPVERGYAPDHRELDLLEVVRHGARGDWAVGRRPSGSGRRRAGCDPAWRVLLGHGRRPLQPPWAWPRRERRHDGAHGQRDQLEAEVAVEHQCLLRGGGGVAPGAGGRSGRSHPAERVLDHVDRAGRRGRAGAGGRSNSMPRTSSPRCMVAIARLWCSWGGGVGTDRGVPRASERCWRRPASRPG